MPITPEMKDELISYVNIGDVRLPRHVMNANEFLHAYVLKHPDEEVDGKDIAGALDQLSNERSDERKLVKLIRADVSETEVSFGENVFYTTLN